MSLYCCVHKKANKTRQIASFLMTKSFHELFSQQQFALLVLITALRTLNERERAKNSRKTIVLFFRSLFIN